MGGICVKSSKRYSVAFNGSRGIVLKSHFLTTSALTAALLEAMTTAPSLLNGGYEIFGVTRIFTDTEWPAHYRKQICDAVNVLQFRMCLSSSAPIVRYNRDVCTVDIGSDLQFLRVSVY